MIRRDLIQGTPVWHEWRKGGIGGSLVGAVIGACPYKTPHDAWLELTGRVAGFQGNEATEHGKKYEGRAIALHQELTGVVTAPACAIHPDFPECRVSLDGLTDDGLLILETKCPFRGTSTMRAARAGRVVDHYGPQVFFQLAVTGAKKLHFFVLQGASYENVVVEPDERLQESLISMVSSFWHKHVLTDVAPALTDRDARIVTEPSIVELCDYIKTAHKAMDKRQLDFLKERVVRMAGHPNVRCGEVEISTVFRGGKISYYKLTVRAAA